MYGTYNLLLGLAAPIVLPALRLPWFRDHRERLALYPEDTRAALAGRRVIWVHNASVGELAAATPLVERLAGSFPAHRLLLSATSLAGRSLASRLPAARAAVLLPLDFGPCVERALAVIRPEVFVFTETELWPNLLRALGERRVPAVLVSGRISPAAFRRYRRLRSFFRRVLSHVAFFGMQSDAEAERIVELGAPPDRVTVTGNLKHDRPAEAPAIPIADGGPVWIAGSTRPNEEGICLDAFERVRLRVPALRLVLAPRHLDRVAEVAELIAARRLPAVRRSTLGAAGWTAADAPILVLDTLGELAGLYTAAAVAFVGGTLAPHGGHNLAEPARAGVPVLFGPHVENVVDAARVLERDGGGRRVADADALARAVEDVLVDADLRRRAGAAAAAAFPGGRALDRSFESVRRFLSRE
ncbi:MAG: 3-deoxy-D-manno-octulosonic-acid transferase [Candidatus Binatota bacterium]|nr:3-deoxy-D-manno-octulosonic-acid transferase [Candidatus Binatota bacterium]